MDENIKVEKADSRLHEVDSVIHPELRRWMPQAFSEFRPDQPDSPNVREKFNNFYDEAAKRMQYFNASVEKCRLIDPDFTADFRPGKQQALLVPALAYFWGGMAGAIADLEESFANADKNLETAKNLKPLDPDSIEALRRDLLFSEIRQELRAGDEVGRITLLMKAAEAGNLSVLNAVELAPFPMVPENVLRDAYKVFLTSQKELVKAVEEAAFFREVLTVKRFIINRGVELLGRSNFH
ncbi:MAG: hypothetical protein ACYDH8_14380 [Syntrophales bacterium]